MPDSDRIANLIASFDRLLDRRRRPLDPVLREAIILILLTMQTGMPREILASITVRRCPSLDLAGTVPSILLTEEGDFILLAAPVGPNAKGVEAVHRIIADRIVLPLSRVLRQAITSDGTGTVAERAVFTSATRDVDRCLRRLLRGGSDWRSTSVKAERGLRAMERWLRQRLRLVYGGDPGFSAILDPHRKGAERTISAYTTVSADRYWRAYRKALSPIDGTLARVPPTALASLTYGDPRCPDDRVLRNALIRIARLCGTRPIPKVSRKSNSGVVPDSALGSLPISRVAHLARMMRCFAMATFGTGQRGMQHLVRFDEIDPDTGFAWVVEKANPKGYSGERGVFHSRSVRRQLAAYEEYLDAVAIVMRRVDPSLAGQLVKLRAEPGIAFFDIKRGRVVRLSSGDLCRAASVIHWPFDMNAGRRWLRSALIGRVPSDALAAQFGHYLGGFDVWGDHSGLDPAAVARVLEPAIERALRSIDLSAARTRTRRAVGWQSACRGAAADKPSARYRSGQILASAIWDGALLDARQEGAFVKTLKTALAERPFPEWMELDDTAGGISGTRWHVDAKTRRLMDQHGCAREIGGAPDLILAEFLGPDVAVEQWRGAARLRWRCRLPPLLYAYACGKLENHSLEQERFDPQRGLKLRPTFKPGSWRDRRSTGAAFIDFLWSHWDQTDQHSGAGRDQAGRKRRTYHSIIPVLGQADFYRRMSPLERSLAQGIVEGLQCDRGRLNPRGYSMFTLVDRVERLWRYFLPQDNREWESRKIDELDAPLILTAVAPRLWCRSDVINDVLVILKALPKSDKIKETIQRLEIRPDNYTTDLLTAEEYDRASEQADSAWAKTALALCYRTGIRFTELSRIERSRIRCDDDGPSQLTLDHGRHGRLKTFHSRRRIPLDVLLLPEERHDLACLMAAPGGSNGRLFPYLKTDDPSVNAALMGAAGEGMSVYPLRHAFATNALAALLWPSEAPAHLERYFDRAIFENRGRLKARLCGKESLGGNGPHTIACVMGHTSPHRTLYSYAHHLEVALAAHVCRAAEDRRGLAPPKPH